MDAILRGLHTPPSETPLGDLRPIFVPQSFFAYGNWPGPYELCRIAGLGLTWTVMTPEQTMRYVDRDLVAFW